MGRRKDAQIQTDFLNYVNDTINQFAYSFYVSNFNNNYISFQYRKSYTVGFIYIYLYVMMVVMYNLHN